MNNENDVIKTRKHILIFAALSFVLVIIAFSIVINAIINRDTSNVSIVNQQNVAGVVNTKDYNIVKEAVRAVLKSRYNISDDEEINASIRESTYSETGDDDSKRISFLIDIENVKVTYSVWINHSNPNDYLGVSLSCTTAKEAKYPETFCIGTEGHSSIDTMLASDLPHRKIVNDEVLYTVSHVDYEPVLDISLYTKCDDKRTQEQYMSEIKEWIKGYGLDPEQVRTNLDQTACSVYEDNMGDFHGGHGN